ncbi:MAG: hypothetical protein LBM96_05105 [Methanobrevibacter sp.]|jgi:hypothetical protein|nr:hypothetical protein [Candidatus Methanoflexus mossambicus]
MIVADVDERFKDAKEVLDEVNIMINRIKRGNNAIGKNLTQYCIYCGKGKYSKKIIPQNYGFNKNNRFDKLLVCDYCGNIQIFVCDVWNETVSKNETI